MEFNTKKLSGLELVGAKRITSSYKEIPQFCVSTSIDMSVVEEARQKLKSQHQSEYRISVTPFIIKAVAEALKKHELINAVFQEPDTVLILKDINIGVAVDTPRGLVVPVIRHADRLSMVEIANMLDEIVKKCKEGKLRKDDISDGTFTISNLGMFGVEWFNAIINPPQSAILAVSASIKKPVVINDKIIVRPLADFTLTSDHRVIDGAKAARFITDLKKGLENFRT